MVIIFRRLKTLVEGTNGNQIAEFAVTLPMLMVVAVGIFDFGAAFTVKEKLVGVAQTAARVGAAQPSNDLTATSGCTKLVSVCAVRDVVSQSLLHNKLKDCGLAAMSPVSGPGNLTWTMTANTGCPNPIKLTVERGFSLTATLTAPFDTRPMHFAATKVTLTYPYQWQFNKVLGLLGGNFTGPVQLTTVAVMENLN